MSSLSPLEPMLREDPPETAAPARASRARRRIPKLTVLGLVMILAGLSLLGYVGYQYYGTNIISEQNFDVERDRLRSEWENPAPPQDKKVVGKPVPDGVIGLLRIPRLGKDYEVPLVSGISRKALAKGVGVYESSAAPGEIGNFTLAGHRVTNGEPFRRILEVKAGDLIIVETREAIFTYVMESSPADLTVLENEDWVIQPVPGKPNVSPTEALITLTTCTDLFRSPDRSVGFGRLSEVQEK